MIRVLVVEDQKIMQKYFEYMLSQEPEFIQVPILGSFSAIVVRHLQASAFSILMIISMLGLGIVAVSIFLYTRHRQLVEKRFVNVAVF